MAQLFESNSTKISMTNYRKLSLEELQLFEKEFTHTSLTINALLVYEWGKDIKNELESEFRLKYRYRYSPAIQPSIEIYTGEDFVGIGPGFMGIHRYQGQKQLKWELAFIAGLNGDSKDHTLRFALEYEF